MAKATGLSQTAASRIRRAFGLEPHLVGSWRLSTDPQLLDRLRDLDLRPRAAATLSNLGWLSCPG